MKPSERRHPIPKKILKWLVLGLVVIFLAFILQTLSGGVPLLLYISSLLADVGVAIALVGVLVTIERDLSQQQANLVELFKRSNDKIESKLQNLMPNTDYLLIEKDNQEEAIFWRIQDDRSYNSFLSAFTISETRGLIGPNGLTVRTGGPLKSPRLRILFSKEFRHEERVVQEELRVSLEFLGENGSNIPEISWDPSKSLDAEAVRLLDEAERLGHWRFREYFSVDVVARNLSKTLLLADSSRKDPDSWLSGNPVNENFLDDWIITEAGLEVEGHGIAVPREVLEGLLWDADIEHQSNREDLELNSELSKPEWANEGQWSLALQRTARHFSKTGEGNF